MVVQWNFCHHWQPNVLVSTTITLYNECLDGLMQERCNSSALAMEICLSCTNPSVWCKKRWKLLWDTSCPLCYIRWYWFLFELCFSDDYYNGSQHVCRNVHYKLHCSSEITLKDITVTSHELHSIWNHQWLNSSVWLTAKQTSKLKKLSRIVESSNVQMHLMHVICMGKFCLYVFV